MEKDDILAALEKHIKAAHSKCSTGSVTVPETFLEIMRIRLEDDAHLIARLRGRIAHTRRAAK